MGKTIFGKLFKTTLQMTTIISEKHVLTDVLYV